MIFVVILVLTCRSCRAGGTLVIHDLGTISAYAPVQPKFSPKSQEKSRDVEKPVIGLLGGGQLGRMLQEVAISLGLRLSSLMKSIGHCGGSLQILSTLRAPLMTQRRSENWPEIATYSP